MMTVGPFRLDAVELGEFRLDGGAMFGVVPKVLWEKQSPADEKNRIRMNVRSLLIRGLGRTILVDSGLGTQWTEKQTAMFAIDHSRFDPIRSLAPLGVAPQDITDVILSHLHFDHVGGALIFQNAKYYVERSNLSHAHAPTEKDRASFLEEKIEPLLRSGRLVILDGNQEIVPGVSTYVTHGHTPGQNLVKVTDNKTTVLACGDTIPMMAHVSPAWVMAYDLFPMTTIEEKKKILESAVANDWVLFLVHDPVQAAVKVVNEGGKFLPKPFVF